MLAADAGFFKSMSLEQLLQEKTKRLDSLYQASVTNDSAGMAPPTEDLSYIEDLIEKKNKHASDGEGKNLTLGYAPGGEDNADLGLDASDIDDDAPILGKYGSPSTPHLRASERLQMEPLLDINGNDTQEVSIETLNAAIDAAQAAVNQANRVYEEAWIPPPGTHNVDMTMVANLRDNKTQAELVLHAANRCLREYQATQLSKIAATSTLQPPVNSGAAATMKKSVTFVPSAEFEIREISARNTGRSVHPTQDNPTARPENAVIGFFKAIWEWIKSGWAEFKAFFKHSPNTGAAEGADLNGQGEAAAQLAQKTNVPTATPSAPEIIEAIPSNHYADNNLAYKRAREEYIAAKLDFERKKNTHTQVALGYTAGNPQYPYASISQKEEQYKAARRAFITEFETYEKTLGTLSIAHVKRLLTPDEQMLYDEIISSRRGTQQAHNRGPKRR